MYELKKVGKVFTSKFVGTGRALVLWKKNLRGRGLTKVEKHCPKLSPLLNAGHNGPDHDQQHCYHDASTVNPEAATAVIELLMMGVRTPETCWAVHKRQLINLRNCCI
jgi:hypothetical protein